jgi:small subunit ribosomal protein S16
MKRFGRTNQAHYRVNAMDGRAPRNGRIIEELGVYDPHAADDQKMKLNVERVQYWLSVGAQPSDTVRSFLKKAGLLKKQPAVVKAADAQ